MSDELVRRVRRWAPEDPARTMAAVLEWAVELVPQGLRLPTIERFVQDPLVLTQASPEVERRCREAAHSPSWRAAAVEQLRALADDVLEDGERVPAQPSRLDACLFAERALRQHHTLDLVEAAEHDPDSIHSALSEEDRVRLRDLILGRSGGPLDDTVARWHRFVTELDDWGYDEYASFMSTRGMLSLAEAAVSPAAAMQLRNRYAAIDRHYLELTQPLAHAIQNGAGRWSAEGWWCYRAPLNMDAAFASSAGCLADGAGGGP